MEFMQYRKISVIVIPEETHTIYLYHKIMIMIRENIAFESSNRNSNQDITIRRI